MTWALIFLPPMIPELVLDRSGAMEIMIEILSLNQNDKREDHSFAYQISFILFSMKATLRLLITPSKTR